MNAAYHNLNQGNLFQGSLRRFNFTKQSATLMLLLGIMLFSAFTVVYVKNYERRLFSQLQYMHQQADKLQVEWGQLLLEQSTWATPARVHSVAIKRYGMKVPSADHLVMVRL